MDALFVFIGLFISVEFYFSLSVPESHVIHLWRTLPILLVTTLAALWLSGIYRQILAYAGQDVLIQCGSGGRYFLGIAILPNVIAIIAVSGTWPAIKCGKPFR